MLPANQNKFDQNESSLIVGCNAFTAQTTHYPKQILNENFYE